MSRLIAVVALLTFVQPGQPPESKQTTEELLTDLCSDNMAASEAAERELHNRLNALSSGLKKTVWTTHKVEKDKVMMRKPLDRALGVLKRLNYSQLARPLMINVSYFDHSAATNASFTSGYPCATMLSGLGPTAAYEIVNYLERPPVDANLSNEALDLFARVIRTVFSHHGGTEEAQAMLTRAHRRAKNKQHIERLQKRFREIVEAPKAEPPANPEST